MREARKVSWRIQQSQAFCLFAFIFDLSRRITWFAVISPVTSPKITTTDFPSGQCVVKVYKNGNFTQDFFLDFAASQYAYEKAIEFNKIIGIPNKINFILPYSGSVHLLAGFKLFGLFKVTDDDSEKYIFTFAFYGNQSF